MSGSAASHVLDSSRRQPAPSPLHSGFTCSSDSDHPETGGHPEIRGVDPDAHPLRGSGVNHPDSSAAAQDMKQADAMLAAFDAAVERHMAGFEARLMVEVDAALEMRLGLLEARLTASFNKMLNDVYVLTAMGR